MPLGARRSRSALEAVSRNRGRTQASFRCGYSTEYEVERFYRDAPLMAVGEGTNDILRKVIARPLYRAQDEGSWRI